MQKVSEKGNKFSPITWAYLGYCGLSMMKCFYENTEHPLATIYFHKRLHRRCLTGF